MHAAFSNCRIDGFGHDLRRPGVRGMPLHDNGTTCRERRRRIPTGRRKCQGKIRRTKDCNGSNRPLDNLEVGARQGLPIRKRNVMPQVKIVAAQNVVGKTS